jgi:uncharacterized integral membrane protein
MNKKISIVFIVLAVVLIAYNVTIIDFKNPLGEDSIIAVIGVLAALCAIVLLLIFITSKKIQKKVEER